MITFNEDYKLGPSHYYEMEYEKTQIVIGNSLTSNMKHISRWEKRLNGECKSTSPFTISTDGTIYKHYNPKYYSEFIRIGHLDKRVIGITLENEGALFVDEKINKLVNWNGDIYNRTNKIKQVKWRDREIWAPYTSKQMESLTELCHYLSKEYNIPLQSSGHNTVIMSVGKEEGILFRSNFSPYYYDVSPAFNFKGFDNKLKKINKQS